MTILQAIVSIVVALIAGTTGGGLVFTKFIIERKDKKEENIMQKKIDDSIKEARKEISAEIKAAVQQGIVDCGVIGDKAIREVQDEFLKKLDEGLRARSEEGYERFSTHAKAINEVTKQIEENSKQIGTLTDLTKDLVTSIDGMNSVLNVTAKANRNSIYDKLLMVTNKILKNNVMTITDKTNLRGLYQSWRDLNGEDEEIETKYEECMKMTPVLDEN